MSLDLSSSFHQFRISMTGRSKSGISAFDNFTLDVDKLMLASQLASTVLGHEVPSKFYKAYMGARTRSSGARG